MSKDTLPFGDKEFSKLSHSVFPTIRREDKYGEVGDINTIEQGEKGSRDELGTAKIVAKETRTIDDLSESFLCFDTESSEWDDAYKSLNSHYDELIEIDEDLTVYWSMWTERFGEANEDE